MHALLSLGCTRIVLASSQGLQPEVPEQGDHDAWWVGSFGLLQVIWLVCLVCLFLRGVVGCCLFVFLHLFALASCFFFVYACMYVWVVFVLSVCISLFTL